MEKQADWLIAGLGNPGRRYEKTRHNIASKMLFVKYSSFEYL